MKVAALVLSAFAPAGITYLSEYFWSAADVFVHIDARVAEVAMPRPSGVRFINRRRVFWAGWSMVEAIFDLIDAALLAGDYDRFLLISDDSVPIVPIDDLLERLSQGGDLIWSFTGDESAWLKWRYDRFYFPDSPLTSVRHLPLEARAADEALFESIRDAQRLMNGVGKKPVEFAGGWRWWALTRKTIELVLRTHREDEWLRTSFRFSAHPDSHYIQTIIGAVTQRPFMFSEWGREVKPWVFREAADLAASPSDGFLFARKVAFDSPEIVNLARTGRIGRIKESKLIHGTDLAGGDVGGTTQDAAIHTPTFSMESRNFTRLEALHSEWRGFLRLSTDGNFVLHEEHGSRGVYTLSGTALTVSWDEYKPDTFFLMSGIYIHENLVRSAPRLTETLFLNIGERPIYLSRASVTVPGSDYEVILRARTTDVPTFEQVFVRNEYGIEGLPDSAFTVVDIGANIGLATVFFGLRYPEATIVSVEPEESNFSLLAHNTSAFGDRVRRSHAAIWIHDGVINLHTEDESGESLGAWGVRVSEQSGSSSNMTRCYKISSLLDAHKITTVDILKIDIEGAELEVFSNDSGKWLQRVSMIIVEPHDRFRTGCEAAIRSAVYPIFEELPRSGENLIFRRRVL